MTATLICIRDPTLKGSRVDTVWRQFASAAELMKADQVLLSDQHGCGDPRCNQTHYLAWADERGTHVRSSRHDRVDRPSLEEELDRLYPRRWAESAPERWQIDPESNAPFERARDGSVLHEQFTRGRRIALAQLLAEVPPNGRPTPPLAAETGVAGVVAPATPRICSVAGCGRTHQARSYCQHHYDHRKHRGLLPSTRTWTTMAERFWTHVDRTGEHWLWTGGRAKGYGYFHARGGYTPALVPAHRFAWEMERGRVPRGRKLARRPDCPRNCVRPDHWQLNEPKEPPPCQV
jgi:hypothetical protein